MAESKTKHNIKLKPTDSFLFTKQFTDWLTSKDKKQQSLEYLINHFNQHDYVLRRLFAYFFKTPYLIWYFNEYINNKFGNYDLYDTIYSVIQIIENHINDNISKTHLTYFKVKEFQDRKRDKISQSLSSYFSLHDDLYIPNKAELNHYYNLFNQNVLTEEIISYVDNLISGRDTGKFPIKDEIVINTVTTTIQDSINNKTVKTESNKFNPIDINYKENWSPRLKVFYDELLEYKESNEQCAACPLFNKDARFFNTNLVESGNVDVMFVGSMPFSNDTQKIQKVKMYYTQIFRDILNNQGMKFIEINLFGCECHNKNDLAEEEYDKAIECCSGIIEKICNIFEAEITVPLNDDCLNAMGIEEPILKASGLKYDDGKIIPLLNPGLVIDNPELKNKFRTDLNIIINTIVDNKQKQLEKNLTKEKPKQKEVKEKKRYVKQELKLDRIPKEKIIEEVSEDLTFLDVCELDNNKVLEIYINNDGEKRYRISEFEFEIKIKHSDYNDCPVISDIINETIIVNEYEKTQITKALRNKMKELKQI